MKAMAEIKSEHWAKYDIDVAVKSWLLVWVELMHW